MVDTNSLIVPAVTVLTFIFMVAAACTPWVTAGGYGYGIYNSCNPDGYCTSGSLGCRTRNDVRSADAAFTTMGCIFIAFGATLAILRIFFSQINQAPYKIIVFVLCACTVVCAFFSWVFAFALFDSSMCGVRYKDFANTTVGPQGPLALIAFILAIIACAAEFMLNTPFAGVSSASFSASSSSGDNKNRTPDNHHHDHHTTHHTNSTNHHHHTTHHTNNNEH